MKSLKRIKPSARLGLRIATFGAALVAVANHATADPATNWNVALLDKIIAAVPADQKLAPVGDMEILVTNLRTWRNQIAGESVPGFAFDGVAPAWTGGNLYYTFDASVSAAKQKAFLDGAAEWAMFANLHFIPRTSQPNYFTVLEDPTLGGGQSAVGMVGGQQFLKIGPGAWNRATICHELGHTLGLVHEHQRSDRDAFVVILTNNILPGSEGNFVKLGNTLNTGTYDFYSVMHYRRDAFSVNPPTLNTIEPVPAFAQFLNVMGQQYEPVLSVSDRAGMAAKYGAGPALNSVVINTLESGPGSLRAALYYALDHPGTTVTFNIPTSDPGFAGGVFTIQPTDSLPALRNATFLDGSSEPTNTNPSGPEIVLNGALCDPVSVYVDGLRLLGTNCVVQSLIVNGFPGSGIVIDGTNASGNVVRGCYLGLDSTGTSAVTNKYNPLIISGGASGNTVGGTNVAARNVLSGSAYQGLVIRDTGTRSNLVQGNFIGLNAAGSAALPNAWAGLEIYGGAQANTIGGTTDTALNIISGNLKQGVAISGTNTTGNVVAGNFIGLNPAGNAALPNAWAGLQIFGGAKSNLIGGTSAAARNLISGNTLQGATVSDPGTVGNVIAGNYIGLNAAGSAAVPNGWSGIQFFGGAQSNTLGGATSDARNIISGNTFQGIALSDANTSGNVVAGNYIGLNPAGTAAMGNGWSGIEIFSGATSNLIGGTTTGAANLISGNTNYGLFIGYSGTDGNVVAGNYVGVDVSGTQALGNGWSGVALYGGAQGNVIGGSAANAGNVISGNANYGVTLSGTGTSGNNVQGNLVGLSATGAQPLGNGWDGVSLYGGASGNLIGLASNNTGAGNTIALNAFMGIVLFDAATTNNSLRGNNVYSNGYLGINLAGGVEDFSGVTVNDPGDPDTGPNNLQNYPVLTQAAGSGASTIISGTLNGAPGRTMLVDVYRSSFADSSGYGEGQNYIGSTITTTSGGGSAAFTLTAAGNFAGQYITATATDQTTGDTSEFSLALLATNGPAIPTFTSPVTLTSTGFNAHISLAIGQNYRVQATTNLGATPILWLDLTNFVASVTNYSFLDRTATNFPHRFYRVVSP